MQSGNFWNLCRLLRWVLVLPLLTDLWTSSEITVVLEEKNNAYYEHVPPHAEMPIAKTENQSNSRTREPADHLASFHLPRGLDLSALELDKGVSQAPSEDERQKPLSPSEIGEAIKDKGWPWRGHYKSCIETVCHTGKELQKLCSNVEKYQQWKADHDSGLNAKKQELRVTEAQLYGYDLCCVGRERHRNETEIRKHCNKVVGKRVVAFSVIMGISGGVLVLAALSVLLNYLWYKHHKLDAPTPPYWSRKLPMHMPAQLVELYSGRLSYSQPSFIKERQLGAIQE